MIGFKDFINEIFDARNIYPYYLVSNSYDRKRIEFKSDSGDILNVIISVHLLRDKSRMYEISFYSKNSGYELSKSNNLQETLKIYNTVLVICKDIIGNRLRSDDLIWFGNQDPRAFNTYKRLSAIIAKSYNGILDVDESKREIYIVIR